MTQEFSQREGVSFAKKILMPEKRAEIVPDCPSGTKRSAVGGHGPGVGLQFFHERCQGELNVAQSADEAAWVREVWDQASGKSRVKAGGLGGGSAKR